MDIYYLTGKFHKYHHQEVSNNQLNMLQGMNLTIYIKNQLDMENMKLHLVESNSLLNKVRVRSICLGKSIHLDI